MNWNYETELKRYIAQAVSDTGNVADGFTFEVCNEQAFVKMKSLKPNTVYVVIKYLSTTNTLQAVTQPIQITIMCEQNSLQASQIVFSKLVASHNFETIITEGTYIKQDYREPVILSNFNEVAAGYRSVMYISATLFIMENLIDVSEFTIDDEDVKPINFNIAYTMTPNTQPIPPSKIATSVKSVASFSVSFSVPLTTDYAFLATIANIMKGETSGNTDFKISFTLGSVEFEEVPMKLVSTQITTAINEIPSIQIGLIK